jgi:hypothetical protein
MYKRALAAEDLYRKIPPLVAEQMTYQLKYAGLGLDKASESVALEACFKQALGEEAWNALSNEQRLATDEEIALIRSCNERFAPPPDNEESEGGMPRYFQNLSPADWEAIFRVLLPADWMQAQIESVIDHLFVFLDSTEPDISLSIDMQGLKKHLEGGAAMEAFMIIVNAQPLCTPAELEALISAPMKDIPSCRPPEAVVESFIENNQSTLVELVAKIPAKADLTKIGSDSAEPPPNAPPSSQNPGPLGDNPRVALTRIRLILRLSPILPVGLLLLVTLFGVRSPKGWLLWWGIPLLIVGAIVGSVAFLAMPLADYAIAVYVVGKTPQGFSPAIFDLLLDIGKYIARGLVSLVGRQAGIVALLGFSMIFVSLFIKGKGAETV